MDHATVPDTFLDLIGRLALAIVVATVIGIDRELHRKPAGLRTHALVAIGACLFTMTGLLLGADQNDPSATGRIVQGLVAGVGFIGAGTIFRQNGDLTGKGLTTAASIWVVAALGTVSGAGLWRTAVAAAVVVVCVLVLDPLDRWLQRRGAAADAARDLQKRVD